MDDFDEPLAEVQYSLTWTPPKSSAPDPASSLQSFAAPIQRDWTTFSPAKMPLTPGQPPHTPMLFGQLQEFPTHRFFFGLLTINTPTRLSHTRASPFCTLGFPPLPSSSRSPTRITCPAGGGQRRRAPRNGRSLRTGQRLWRASRPEPVQAKSRKEAAGGGRGGRSRGQRLASKPSLGSTGAAATGVRQRQGRQARRPFQC
jgi:hypothetical protein